MDKQTDLPLFYQHIEAFDSARHGTLLRPAGVDFRFAAGATVIPLVINELPLAMRHYPLVFLSASESNVSGLAALVGVGNERNLFVSADGTWQAGAYIPAYVRRYPFHALRVETQPDPLLAIDTSYVAAKEGETLVASDGKPSAYLDEMLAFTRDYLAAAERTDAMCRALQEAGVLETGDITLQSADGTAHQINGFLQVSEERLRALTLESLGTLHQVDALGLAYAQLLSMANFVHLPLDQTPASAPTQWAAKPSRARRKEQVR